MRLLTTDTAKFLILITILTILAIFSIGCSKQKVEVEPKGEVKYVTSGTATMVVRHEIVLSVSMLNAFAAECSTELDPQICVDVKSLQFIKDMLEIIKVSQ